MLLICNIEVEIVSTRWIILFLSFLYIIRIIQSFIFNQSFIFYISNTCLLVPTCNYACSTSCDHSHIMLFVLYTYRVYLRIIKSYSTLIYSLLPFFLSFSFPSLSFPTTVMWWIFDHQSLEPRWRRGEIGRELTPPCMRGGRPSVDFCRCCENTE